MDDGSALDEASVGAPEKSLVGRVQTRLEAAGIRTWVFGGWAEEFHGLILPREHGDIDLLYPAEGFRDVDGLLRRSPDLDQISGKRFVHKRAFTIEGVMVELFLLQPRAGRYVTDFWAHFEFEWPENVLAQRDGMRIASPDALSAYRRVHGQIEELRQSLQALPIDK